MIGKSRATRTIQVVGFSGGADSQAVALLVRQRFRPEDIVLLNSTAGGNEHPVTEQFIADYSRDVFPVVVVRALIRDLGGVGTRFAATRDRRQQFSDDDELTFDRLALIKGRFPSTKAQFCTEYLKLAPSRRWIREHLEAKGQAYERWIGVRRDESTRRACVTERECDDYFDCPVNRPIAAWTKPEVFAFLREHGEPINPLYTMGFGRVGCAPCINSNKEDVRLWAARFPEMIDKVREWEKRVGRSFFPPKMIPGKTVAFVDEVVAWSRTERGGKQLSLPLLEAEVEAGGCMSRWGLCE